MRYVFGNFWIDTSRLEFSASGQLRPVEPQVFDVLRYLIVHRDRVVSMQELIDSVWGGRIVSDAAIASRIRDVRRALGDDGKEQRWLRTVRGRGFRFSGEVVEEHPDRVPAAPAERPEVAADSGGLPAQSEQIVAEMLERPAIAVLPIENHSETPHSDYLADGLTDEIIGALSAWRWFPVIARNTSQRFRGSVLGAREIGRKCRARYLISGALRCDGLRIRLSIDLVDAEHDTIIWSGRINRRMDDLLTLEEEIATDLVTMLEPEISSAEFQRVLRKAPSDFSAWDLAMRARWHTHLGQFESLEAAESLAAEAAAREPGWYLPHTLIAQCRFQRAMMDFSRSDARTAFAATLDAARHALEIDRGAWLAHALAGVGELWTNLNHDRALEHVHRAIGLNPSASQTYHFGGCITGFAGDPSTARRHQHRIARLDAVYPYAAVIESDLGLWHMLDGNLDDADQHLARAESLDPRYPRALQRRIALSGLQDRRDEANRALNRLRDLGVPLDGEALRISYPFRKEEHQATFYDGIRKAGFNI